MKTKPKKEKPLTLAKMVETIMSAGAKVKIQLEADPYATRPGDHVHVSVMLKQARYLRDAAMRLGKKGRIDGAYSFNDSSHRLAFAACWLRCYLKGEFKK